jgi:putative restriction endonuclease
MTGPGLSFDQRLRWAAISFLEQLAANGKPVVRQSDLADFTFEGQPIRLMPTQQGIWKPKQLSAALSFRTVYTDDPSKRPYADDPGGDGFLRYKWRGQDAQHFENRALREAMLHRLPLIFFQGVAVGVYLPVCPVYLVGEEPESHQFVVSLDEELLRVREDLGYKDPELLRTYAERTVQVRLHQPLFRQRVLLAYANKCALCHLRHTRLLDAAHVIPDSAGGQPVVTNGISMCKIHHAAYDADIFGISPDYRVGVRPDVMKEIDGPTLRYTLQAINGSRIDLPRRQAAKPDPEALDVRWKQFLDAS